jgi:lipopolysaccharide/colanic/teichoic acid biosynthesis glycosyltransferase
MNKLFIRCFDFIFSLFGLIILAPVFIVIAIFIKAGSKGKIFFSQRRVGKGNKDFSLFKFRTMYVDADRHGLITVGARDSRITSAGLVLRKYKLDELPQLINVFFGEMSLVGPRPEVRMYVNLYTSEQLKVLSVKPGITDYSSIEFSNENEMLSKSSTPEKLYISELMPAKILLSMKFISEPTLKNYFTIIFKTIGKIFS